MRRSGRGEKGTARSSLDVGDLCNDRKFQGKYLCRLISDNLYLIIP